MSSVDDLQPKEWRDEGGKWNVHILHTDNLVDPNLPELVSLYSGVFLRMSPRPDPTGDGLIVGMEVTESGKEPSTRTSEKFLLTTSTRGPDGSAPLLVCSGGPSHGGEVPKDPLVG